MAILEAGVMGFILATVIVIIVGVTLWRKWKRGMLRPAPTQNECGMAPNQQNLYVNAPILPPDTVGENGGEV